MNDRVAVRLTETGLRIYDRYEADLGLPKRHRRMSINDGNLWRGELWRLMQEFGPHLIMGMPETPFVDNRIDLESGLRIIGTAEAAVLDAMAEADIQTEFDGEPSPEFMSYESEQVVCKAELARRQQPPEKERER